MALKLFNTLSRKKELFEPLNSPSVGLYTCGPTVYNYLHIGNWRAYIFSDILKRYLIYRGYSVKHIMNITDVEDKIIKAIKEKKESLEDLTQKYTNEFYKSRDLLNILPASKYTKATDYIKEMLELIETLLEKGFAYKTDTGSIYFDITKYKEYGKLSHFKISDLKENAHGRMICDEYEKENAQDFALWKAWEEKDGDVFWEPEIILNKKTNLTKGRPGWHIECSAMSIKELGESFDLHTGGVDNIFPHHENEIAQSESATGKPFAKYFMHNEFLLVDNKKMSKSLGNFYTLRDLIEKEIDPIAFRLWLYTSHYKTKTNFTLETVKGSETALTRIRENFLSLGDELGKVDEKYKNKLVEAMDNDLDTPKALTVLWDLIKDSNISNSDKKATLLDFNKVFGLGLDKLKKDIIPEEIIRLSEEREEARRNKNWDKSDELRDKIKKLGYEVKDGSNCPEINKI